MKRLTKRLEDGQAVMDCTGCPESWNTNPVGKCTALYCRNMLKDRLAAIENILGDEYELEDLNKALWCKRVVEDAFSDDPSVTERLRKLWFADQKGHCIVFNEHYPVVSEYYRDEEGRYIRESSGVISEAEYKAAMGKGD